ncbi:MAG: HigA family addiction module antitoxin [Pseudomonadota bacterium]
MGCGTARWAAGRATAARGREACPWGSSLAGRPPGALPPGTHPGEILSEEFMKSNRIFANALAIALRVPATRIGTITKGERGVTADTALRLTRYFGTSAQLRMNRQASYDLSVVEAVAGEAIARDVRPRAA